MAGALRRKLPLVVGGIALTAVGFVVIPPIINSMSRKVYKSSVDTSDIDFENMGPEIVRKDATTEDEE